MFPTHVNKLLFLELREARAERLTTRMHRHSDDRKLSEAGPPRHFSRPPGGLDFASDVVGTATASVPGMSYCGRSIYSTEKWSVLGFETLGYLSS